MELTFIPAPNEKTDTIAKLFKFNPAVSVSFDADGSFAEDTGAYVISYDGLKVKQQRMNLNNWRKHWTSETLTWTSSRDHVTSTFTCRKQTWTEIRPGGQVQSSRPKTWCSHQSWYFCERGEADVDCPGAVHDNVLREKIFSILVSFRAPKNHSCCRSISTLVMGSYDNPVHSNPECPIEDAVRERSVLAPKNALESRTAFSWAQTQSSGTQGNKIDWVSW